MICAAVPCIGWPALAAATADAAELLAVLAPEPHLVTRQAAHPPGQDTLQQNEKGMNTAKSTENTTTSTAGMTTGLVTSADGTPIGYLRAGHGPQVVVLHGSNESARSHTRG